MSSPVRPLTGYRVGLSISESEDSGRRGIAEGSVNRTMLRLVSALFGQGVGVVFGHDWRDDGVMEAVHALAQTMQASQPPPGVETAGRSLPLLCNLVPWPDEPGLAEEERVRLRSTLEVRQAGLPPELDKYAELGPLARTRLSAGEYEFVRGQALSWLRKMLDDLSDARVCIGGKMHTFTGAYPGIVEEAWIALEHRKPLYLSGLLGGAAAQLIAAIEGEPMPPDFCERSGRPPIDHPRSPDMDPEMNFGEYVWAKFRESAQDIANSNGLTPEENAELFHTPMVDRAIELVLTGIAGIHRTQR